MSSPRRPTSPKHPPKAAEVGVGEGTNFAIETRGDFGFLGLCFWGNHLGAMRNLAWVTDFSPQKNPLSLCDFCDESSWCFWGNPLFELTHSNSKSQKDGNLFVWCFISVSRCVSVENLEHVPVNLRGSCEKSCATKTLNCSEERIQGCCRIHSQIHWATRVGIFTLSREMIRKGWRPLIPAEPQKVIYYKQESFIEHGETHDFK